MVRRLGLTKSIHLFSTHGYSITGGKMSSYVNQNLAAAYLNVSPRTMERWRYEGVGPVFSRVGGFDKGKVIYSIEALDDFVKLNTKEPELKQA